MTHTDILIHEFMKQFPHKLKPPDASDIKIDILSPIYINIETFKKQIVYNSITDHFLEILSPLILTYKDDNNIYTPEDLSDIELMKYINHVVTVLITDPTENNLVTRITIGKIIRSILTTTLDYLKKLSILNPCYNYIPIGYVIDTSNKSILKLKYKNI